MKQEQNSLSTKFISPQENPLPPGSMDQEGISHYALAIEAAQAGIWDCRFDQHQLIFSDRCRQLLNLPPDVELSHERFLALIYPDDRARISDLMDEILMKKQKNFSLEFRIPLLDLGMRWLEARGQVLYDDAGNATRVLGIIMDVTGHKQGEDERQEASHPALAAHEDLAELRHAEQQARQEMEDAQRVSRQLVAELASARAHLQAVMDQAPLGLIIVEAPSGKILLYNEESARLLGHPLLKSDSYIEYAQYRAIHEDGTPYQAHEYPAAKALLSGKVVRDEHVLYQLDSGILRRLSVSAAPVHDQKGDIISVVCTFYDVSEQYELSRQKDEFISITSHELKTPITTVKGSLQLAKRRLDRYFTAEVRKPDGEVEIFKQIGELIERALSQIDVQRRLIDDLVDASRMQVNKIQLSLRACNIVDLVSRVVEDQRIVAPNRMIDLRLPEERNVVIVLDEDRIGQVVNNYLSNAIKYSPATQPIYAGITPGEQTVRVWVKDNGPGLSQEDQVQVWERFYQVKGRHVQGSGGVNLGLGLYICRELIQLHGGTVGVESKEGEGACFWFELPYHISEEQAQSPLPA